MPGADQADQAILAARLRQGAECIAAAARLSSGRWSVRVPLSVRLEGGPSGITVVAGGPAAPQASTMEGNPDGSPRAHPVYGHGPRKEWTWARQIPVRPFLAEAAEVTQDEVARIVAGVVDDWAEQLGFRAE